MIKQLNNKIMIKNLIVPTKSKITGQDIINKIFMSDKLTTILQERFELTPEDVMFAMHVQGYYLINDKTITSDYWHNQRHKYECDFVAIPSLSIGLFVGFDESLELPFLKNVIRVWINEQESKKVTEPVGYHALKNKAKTVFTYPVEIDGVNYESIKAAKKATGLSAYEIKIANDIPVRKEQTANFERKFNVMQE